ncbi:phosphoribosylglycinamide formyltransferase [Phyllobacterium brassicacearum]|uniref:Phosphoribosylglycinamide formyltransferase n=1 Tax=Phyllobacterium brassicacearum TaxID=314235 RepID=A0A2P7BNP0_9HYPH|nr:phosphoribosylglycinamide formyltransferase [Phyllobacterium brassicacearum]PSH68035.1 phosphoribosylglycinamide formyltransferase [Phyllobacterium brassicacearum]TDQ28296.1 phosphoribosylglycinamide formyltransferase-1 [Phyllobacterium brassicacearum]
MSTSLPKKRVAVLISGRGSNMSALIEAAKNADFPAEIVAVIANKSDAGGLDAARAQGIQAYAIPNRDYASKQQHETAVSEALHAAKADIVCLAGYMRLLSPEFVREWEGKMLNIHPSLLPLFRGLHTHDQALEAGVRVHGCTVHFVTAGMDEGPIIAQTAVPVKTGDTADSLTERVLSVEHETYARALALVATGKAKMENGRTVFSD